MKLILRKETVTCINSDGDQVFEHDCVDRNTAVTLFNKISDMLYDLQHTFDEDDDKEVS